ncbi:hypothetical protein [Macrococcoides canis]|uniref:hypothetical protein n=1 Tax=Macrococcoides canis TaxID=1855823 RepID=UPI00165E64EF|nr:hypothetical protein [Macrococcus canis]QNR07148.1 hypothetical protein GL258_02415 [Macrococcus canis]
MGYFDSIQEHGFLSILIACILIIINIVSSYIMLNRNIKIETITKDRNVNIEKVRTLMAENLLSAHKLKRTVSILFTQRKMDIRNNVKYSDKYTEAINNYYEALNDFTYTYDLLMLYIKSIDPLVDTSRIEEIYARFDKNIKITLKTKITNIIVLDEIDKEKQEYDDKYTANIAHIKEYSTTFIKQWLEESYIEVLGKRRYNKLKR